MKFLFFIFVLLLSTPLFSKVDIKHCTEVMRSKNVITFVPLDKQVQKPEWREYDAENTVVPRFQDTVRMFFGKNLLLKPAKDSDLNLKHFSFLRPKSDEFIFQGKKNKITVQMSRNSNGRLTSYFVKKENSGSHLQFEKQVTFSWHNDRCYPLSFEIREKKKDFLKNFEVHPSHVDKVSIPLCKKIYPKVLNHIKDFSDYSYKKEDGSIFSFPDKHAQMIPKTQEIYKELKDAGVDFEVKSILNKRTQIKPLFLLVKRYYPEEDLVKLDKLLSKFRACESFYNKDESLLKKAKDPPTP